MSSWSREQISVLISEYSKHRCLYAAKSKNHRNKHLRNVALHKIVESLSLIKPGVTEAEVQKKFIGLRTTYANERRKVLSSSLHSGMGQDEIYTPALWYFENMEFLNDHLAIRTSRSSFEPREPQFDGVEDNLSNWEQTLKKPSQYVEGLEDDVDESIENNDSTTHTPLEGVSRASSIHSCMSSAAESSDIKSKPGKLFKATETQEQETALLINVKEKLQAISDLNKPTSNKSEADVFGEFVATQLKRMDQETRMDVQYEIHGLLRSALKK